MTAKHSDLRVERTRRAIRDAFIQLAAERDPDRISVTSLTNLAGINRKTFYLHYDSIEALFDDVVCSVMDDFFENYETTPDVPEDLSGHAIRFFLFMTKQPAYIERLVCLRGYHEFGERTYREQMARYRTKGNPFEWMEPEELELVLHFIRTTALDFYRGWVHRGKRVPPERAAELLAELTCYGAGRLMSEGIKG